MQTSKSTNSADDPRAWHCLACHLRLWIVLAVVLAADLISKNIVFHRLGEPDSQSAIGPAHEKAQVILPGLLEFRTQYNQGAALGIWAGHVWLFIVVGIVALGVFLGFFARSHRRQWFFHAGIALVLAGAIGNIYDRLLYGQVRDFIHITVRFNVKLIGRWPREGLYPYIFNVADIALVVGVGGIMISSMYRAWVTRPAGPATDPVRHVGKNRR